MRSPEADEATPFASPSLLNPPDRRNKKVRTRARLDERETGGEWAMAGPTTATFCDDADLGLRLLTVLTQLERALPSLLDELDFSPEEQGQRGDLF